MYTTGPFALAAGVTLVEDDPLIPRQNERVQVQNLSGFLLTVQIGGMQVPIPPFQAVTISEGGGYQIVAVPTATTNIQGGVAVFLWLQPGEASPVPDGPVSTASSASITMIITPSSGVNTAYTLSGGSPSAVFLTLSGFDAGATMTVKGASSGTTYFTGTVGTGTVAGFAVNGALDQSFDVTLSVGGTLTSATEST